MACQQLPHPNDDGYDGDGGGRGRRGERRSLVAVYGLRQIVVAAALLSEIRRVIARLRLHLPSPLAPPPLARSVPKAYMLFPLSPSPSHARLSCFKTQLSLSCVAIWLLKSTLNGDGERAAACFLPSFLAFCMRARARSHACNTYIYSCPSFVPSPSFPCPFGPFRTIANDFRTSSQSV